MTVAVVANTTPEGMQALATAAAEARLRSVPLAVLSIVDGDTVDDAARSGAEAEVRRTLPDNDVIVHVVPGANDPAGAIVDLVADIGADLVVIGSRRRSAVGKLLMGSTVQRVILDCPVPVLVVKAAES